jgi:hypothetical protein
MAGDCKSRGEDEGGSWKQSENENRIIRTMGNKSSNALSSNGTEEAEPAVEDGPTSPPTSAGTGTSAPLISIAENQKLKKQVTLELKQMKRYPKSISIQRQKLAKLRHYCNSNKYGLYYVKHILNHKNGLELLQSAMRLSQKTTAIQDHACRVCTLMTRHNSRATLAMVPLILDAMKNHKRHLNIQLNGLAALSFWGMDLKEGVPLVLPKGELQQPDSTADNHHQQQPQQLTCALRVVEAGALPVIFNTMLPPWQRDHNFQIQDKALKTLVILTSSSKEIRTAFVTATAWKALQTAMESHADQPKLQLKGIRIFKSIAMDHPGAVSKRLAIVLTAMKNHIDDPTLQKNACALLLLLIATHPPSHSILWQPGGGRDAILAAMQHHTTQEDIQTTAALALQKLPRLDSIPTLGGAIQGQGYPTEDTTTDATHNAIHQGLESIIQGLYRPDRCHTNICKALVRLASENHTNKLDIAAAGGVQGIVNAMQCNLQDLSCQRYGCQALSQLAAVEATKRAMVQEANAIPVIVAAMETHTASDKSHLVALHGIFVLVRLSQLLVNHSRMMPTVPAIVHAMQVHIDISTLQYKAMVVLQKLTSRYVRFKKPMVKAGAVEAILDAMTHHAEQVHIQRLGCQCLLHLHHKTTSMRMVHAGALDVIVMTMQHHLAHNGIQMAAIQAIAEMTQFACHLEHWAIRVQGMQCLVLSVRMHLDNPSFQKLAFGVFLESSKHYRRPLLQRQLVQAGGIGAMLTCMKDHHPAHTSIQQMGFRTIYNLSRHPNWGAIIFRNGGWAVIRQAQRVCKQDEFLQQYALTLLVKLVAMYFLHWFMWVGFHVLL